MLKYDILYSYLHEGEEAVSNDDVPCSKSFSSLEEIRCRMQSIEQQLYEEMIYYKSSGNN